MDPQTASGMKKKNHRYKFDKPKVVHALRMIEQDLKTKEKQIKRN